MGRRRRVLLLAPALLILVAVFQQYAARVHDESPWMGGGFGMFASIDRHTTRELRAVAGTADGDTVVLDVDEWADGGADREYLVRTVRTVPFDAAVDRLARQLGAARWTSSGALTSRAGADDPSEPIDVISVEITISRLRYDPGDRVVALEPLTTRTWERRVRP